MDNSARALFRTVSYGSMISAFLDEATCEDDRIEGSKALINCFRSMADLSGRIMANSVLSRRKLFLKNVNFISKSTEKKLLKLPIFGSQLFNGQYFDTLHTSAENLRDARETKNVYNNAGSYNKIFNKSRDDRTPVNDFNRKRKGDYSDNSGHGAKVARTNTYSNKDNFRAGNFSRKGNFFRKGSGNPKHTMEAKHPAIESVHFCTNELNSTFKMVDKSNKYFQRNAFTGADNSVDFDHRCFRTRMGSSSRNLADIRNMAKVLPTKTFKLVGIEGCTDSSSRSCTDSERQEYFNKVGQYNSESYINKQGATHSPELCYLTWDLFQWCIQNNVTIHVGSTDRFSNKTFARSAFTNSQSNTNISSESRNIESCGKEIIKLRHKSNGFSEKYRNYGNCQEKHLLKQSIMQDSEYMTVGVKNTISIPLLQLYQK
ncbi:unnamed protein product [Mytilus coruscus]|uniref:Uncharacterized protein n=1 Tax=Mytilus coruscus TaxID=42192 RepID=A0A6J8AVP8_MYTCO|nr:unnamed protein product [Mytilus coruscus]